MKRVLAWLAIAAVSVLGACGAGSPPDTAPANVTVKAVDGGATVTWTAEPGLSYWVFYGEGTTITYATRTSLPGYRSVFQANTPNLVAGLTNGTPYAFIVAATKDGSEAGPASASITVTPRPGGDTWSAGAALNTASVNGVAFGGTQFVAVGAGGSIFSSTDAITWTARTSNTTEDLNAVAYFGSRFVAVGANGAALTSSDGISWTLRVTGTSAALNGLGQLDGWLVAVGANGTIMTTVDGAGWSAVNSGTTNSLHAAAGGTNSNRIVAVGASGTVLAAQNPFNTWTAVASPVATDLRGIRRGTDVFAIVGDAGVTLWSADGLTLNPATAPAAGQLRAIALGGQFVAVGAAGAVLTSTDGKTWLAANSGSTAQLNAVVFGSNRFSAVGSNGTNLTSF